MKVLHIDCSLRTKGSFSRELSASFMRQLESKTVVTIDRLDLAADTPGHITQQYTEAMYISPELYTGEIKRELAMSDDLVDRLIASELYVIGIPMYNFSIPSVFKAFIDNIVRPGRTFLADENGFKGLLVGKMAVIINSRGGDYRDETTVKLDFVEPYLRMIFGFIGVTNVKFITIQPTLFYGEEAKQHALLHANNEILQTVEHLTVEN